MNKKDYIKAIIEMLEKSDDHTLLDLIYQLLCKSL